MQRQAVGIRLLPALIVPLLFSPCAYGAPSPALSPAPFWTMGVTAAVAAFVLTIAIMAVWRYRTVLRLNRELTETMAMRKLAEIALRRSEKQIRDIAASLGEGLYVLDENGQVRFMNPEAERLLGWTEAELKGRNMHDVVHSRRPDGKGLAFKECPIHNVIESGRRYQSHDELFLRRNGTVFPVSVISMPLTEGGRVTASVTAFRDISDLKEVEQEREKLIAELQRALAEIRTLHGILPICSSCRKVRDDKGSWQQLEAYIRSHTDASFSHGLCSDCARKLYPDYYEKIKDRA